LFLEESAQVNHTTLDRSVTMHVRRLLLRHELNIEKVATFKSHDVGKDNILNNWEIKRKAETAPNRRIFFTTHGAHCFMKRSLAKGAMTLL
jgi:hypothetical protein